MLKDEYISFDGLGLAELIRSGEVSAKEIAQASLDCIDEANPEINAVIEVFRERGLKADCEEGAFYGVPFLIKDIGPTEEGLKAESGSRLGQGYRAAEETPLMTRYKASGINLLGRSSSPEMAFNVATENCLHGPVANPWNHDYMVGGSSGGAAAAVAAGMVPIAHANDGGGSIRIPASCCGVFGLKPTRGRISYGPGISEALSGFSNEHIVSRSVRDSAAMLDATHGPVPGDPYLLPELTGTYLSSIHEPFQSLNIAVMVQPWDITTTDPECQQAAENVAKLCTSLGHQVEYKDMPKGVTTQDYMEAIGVIWMTHISTWVEDVAAATGRDIDEHHLEASTLACYVFGKNCTAGDYIHAKDIQNTVSRAVGEFFEGYDVLVTPTLPILPKPLGTFNANVPVADGMAWSKALFTASPFTPIFNMTGQPAASVPLFLSSTGLPIGVQLAARFSDEKTLFQLSAQLEKVAGWNKPLVSVK